MDTLYVSHFIILIILAVITLILYYELNIDETPIEKNKLTYFTNLNCHDQKNSLIINLDNSTGKELFEKEIRYYDLVCRK